MLKALKALAKASDSVVVLGLPNVRYILRMDIDKEMAVAYRGSTEECRVLVPAGFRSYVEPSIPRECSVTAYSYDIAPVHGYIIGRSFGEILIGFLKAFAKPGEEIGIPLAYADLEAYLRLSRYWKLRDVSRELMVLRAKKDPEDLDTLVKTHNAVREALGLAQITDVGTLAVECFRRLLSFADGVYLEPIRTSKDVVSLRLQVKKGVYRVGYRWSIPLGKEVGAVLSSLDRSIDRVAVGVHVGIRCLDLVKSIRSRLQQSVAGGLGLDVCGVGVEPCEYPSIAECIYEGIVLDDGMVIKVEVGLEEKIFLPKLFVFRENRVEVY